MILNFLERFKKQTWAVIIITALAYYITARIGYILSGSNEYAITIWPPAAVALCFIFYYGHKAAFGVYIGAFFFLIRHIESLAGDPLLILNYPHIFFIAFGATLQATVGVYLVDKFNLYHQDFYNPKKVGAFYFIIGPLSCLISASVASLTFYMMGTIAPQGHLTEWLLWWISDSSSSIIFVTLIFAWFKFEDKRKKIITLVMCMGIVSTYSILAVGRGWEKDRLDLLFNQEVQSAVDTLARVVDTQTALINNFIGFKRFRPDLEKEDFQAFAENNLKTNKNVRSIAWEEIILDADRAVYEENLSAIHGRDISFWELAVDGEYIPVQTMDHYTVAKFIEPYDKVSFAVGYTLENDKIRYAALQQSLENRTATLTEPGVLVSEPNRPSSIVIYQPTFRDGKLEGFLAMSMTIESLIDEILGKSSERNFEVMIRDIDATHNYGFSSFKADANATSDQNPVLTSFRFLNRTWELSFYKTGTFIEKNKSSQPFFIAMGGTIFASIMSIGIIILSGQRLFLENLVKQRTSDLEKANNAKSEFIANMSHDLRTPLNAIIGFSEIMNNQLFGKLGSKKYEEYIKDINQSSQYLLSLINDILDYSAIDANKRTIQKEEIDLREISDSCLRSLKSLSDGKDIYPVNDIADDFPLVFADQKSLKQILINIISNAIKYTQNGGTINISAVTVKNRVLINVTDNGEGIAEDNIAKIIDPFTRVENNPHLSQEGTGLGLAIVNSLIQLHSGTLNIKSKVGMGTCVTIELPLKTI